MPFASLLMVLVTFPVMLSFTVIAILRPVTVARLNSAALRTLPGIGPRSMREQAASTSTPGTMRFVGVVGLGIVLVIGARVTTSVIEHGIVDAPSDGDAWIVWPILAIGLAQAMFGLHLLIRSRRIFEKYRGRFEQAGAPLQRWMIHVIGVIGLCMAGVVLFVAVSLG